MDASEQKRLQRKLKAALDMCEVGDYLSKHSKGKDYCDRIKQVVAEVRRIGSLGEEVVEEDLTNAGNEVYKLLQYAESEFGLNESEMKLVSNAMAEWAQALSVDEFQELFDETKKHPIQFSH